MRVKSSMILLPRSHEADLTLQALNPGIWFHFRQHRPHREKDDKDPSVSVVSEKSLTMSDGDQLQAKAGLPVLTCISQTPSEPGGSPPLLCFTYFNTV